MPAITKAQPAYLSKPAKRIVTILSHLIDKISGDALARKETLLLHAKTGKTIGICLSMPYTPILATLGYVLSVDRKQVLLVHRNRRPDDPHFGKYNGLGGKLEAGEDVVSCQCREVREESGLECESPLLRGTISWPGFGAEGENWFGFIFLVVRWSGQPWVENADGTLVWVNVDSLLNLPLWEGDRYFLPLVFEQTEKQFHGVMPYRDGRPVSWTYSLT